MRMFHFPRAGVLCKSAPLLVATFLSMPTHASEALARKNDCLGCHAVATKLVGPAYKEVAARYAGQADAQAQLVQSMRNGGVGKWGDLPMPAHPKLSEADAKNLAAWVLNLK
jgi:cytochrome c